MNIKEYIKKYKIKQNVFCDVLGYNKNVLSLISNKKYTPPSKRNIPYPQIYE
jgi:hypothetical protein